MRPLMPIICMAPSPRQAMTGRCGKASLAASAYAHGAIDEVRCLPGVVAFAEVLVRDVLEQRVQVDLLLEVAAERHPLLLADDRHHRRAVELGVVEAVEQVDRARARGR